MEKDLQQRHRCFAVIGMRPAFCENPLPLGYVPIDTQALAMHEFAEGLSIPEQDLASALIDLR
jgi:hypothetical protein